MARRSDSNPPTDLESRIDALYALPLDEFVLRRNALASELKRDEREEEAAEVKKLTRPSLAAWALNQVYWHARPDYDRLIAAGDRMREVQRRALSGHKVDLDEVTRERQQAVRTVVDRAGSLLLDAGQPATDATRQKIAATADTVAAYGSRPQEYTPGRLERELVPPGFEALAGLATGAPPLRLVKPQRDTPAPKGARTAAEREGGTRDRAAGRREEQARQAAEREARQQQMAALRAAKDEHKTRERELERARREEGAASDRLEQLRRELEAARARVTELEDDEQRASKAVDVARRARSAAEFQAQGAAARLRDLESRGKS